MRAAGLDWPAGAGAMGSPAGPAVASRGPGNCCGNTCARNAASMRGQRDSSTRAEADIPELSAVVGCVYSRFHEYWPVLAGHAGPATRSKRSEE
jgi:hypothetical protein